MKILIAYYSRGGGTKQVAQALEQLLVTDGHSVDIEIITPQQEHSFARWFWIRSFKNTCDINPVKIPDVSAYDLICVGSPNWTKLALPVHRYLDTVTGLKYKNVALFSTTAFIPSIEWYIFSAYFLDVTFSQCLENARARNRGNVLFSSLFNRWSVHSDWGKEKLIQFVKKITTPQTSYKEYVLRQRERQGVRFLVIFFPALLALTAYVLWMVQSIGTGDGLVRVLSAIAIIGAVSLFQFLTLLESEKYETFGKYIAGFWVVILWTVIALYSNPSLGRGILGGYILLLTFVSVFREPFAVIVTGLIESGILLFLSFVVALPAMRATIDIPVILVSTGMIALITKSLKDNTIHLLETQEDLELTLDAINKEKDKTATILAHLSDGVLVFDSHKELIYANPQALAYVTGKEVKASFVDDSDLVAINNDPHMQQIFQLVADSISHSELTFNDNRTYEISIEPVRLEEGGPFVIMVDLHDITEKKELDAMKVDFASIAAHELRTPITTIKGYLSLLTEETKKQLSETHALFLQRAVDSTNRLNATIESLLAVTRVEKGQAIITKEHFNIVDTIQETITELLPSAEGKMQSLRFVSDESRTFEIDADELKVKEIISNLIGNAIKYTQEGGIIEVSVDESDRFIQVHVSDNGPGIPEKTQKFLFRKFLRGDNPLTEQTQGVGLGLYLVKSLVELMGGSIWVQSKIGEGTTFSFSLPKEEGNK